jgi:ABC-type polysaccharide/polyol phosphate transport system ATPase subunit
MAIRLEGVSKTYTLYERPWDRLRDALGLPSRKKRFTALHELSLEIPEGCALGIVGDNGAGKSTLLHLLAGSHQPSQGRIAIQGKVLGLLELGVGFHPDFSGAENIYFFADMLGLPRAFVRARFDEIVAFSELEAFMSQPLRTYSSGMKVRLAFALVACLDPDILIVDEALAVGDLHFQKKCIDRMMAFRQSGKTILLCSHSLYQIGMFCSQVLWMQQGRARLLGTPEEVLPAYEAYQLAKSAQTEGSLHPQGPVRITDFAFETPSPMHCEQPFTLRWAAQGPERTAYHVSLSLKTESGRGLVVVGSHLEGQGPWRGNACGKIHFPSLPLLAGEYSAHLRLWDDQGLMIYDEALLDTLVIRRDNAELGLVRVAHHWQNA